MGKFGNGAGADFEADFEADFDFLGRALTDFGFRVERFFTVPLRRGLEKFRERKARGGNRERIRRG